MMMMVMMMVLLLVVVSILTNLCFVLFLFIYSSSSISISFSSLHYDLILTTVAKLNLCILLWVFGISPALFYSIYLAMNTSSLFAGPIADGFCILGVLPLTVNMCYVLTTASDGNSPAALFNATFGNIVGIFVTPLYIFAMLKVSGDVSYSDVLINLTYKVRIPPAELHAS